MEQGVFLPFSSLISSMLLFNEKITSMEIINFISLLSGKNIFIDDDDINMLFLCVDCYNYSYFKIKDGMNYDTILETGETVREFLNKHANQDIINFISGVGHYSEINYSNLEDKEVSKKKFKKILVKTFRFDKLKLKKNNI